MSAGSPRAGRGRTAFIVTAAAIVVVVVLAWVLQATADKGDESRDGASSSGYAVTVRQGGEVLKVYDLAALRSLSQTKVVIDGKQQDGPLLRTVLDDAGADPSETVEVAGAGVRDAGHLTLTIAQADKSTLLDFSDRGTVKLCGAWLDRSAWVRDVISIDAR